MIFNAVAKIFQAAKQQKAANKIKPINANYEANPAASNLYAQARNQYQGRMAGANALEQNLFTSQANTVANANRNATDASQALAVSAAAQGQTAQGLNNLAIQESQDKQNRFGMLSNATGQMIDEGDKVFQDKLRNYYDDLNKKNSLEAAAMQNRNAIWGALDDAAGAAVSLLSPGGQSPTSITNAGVLGSPNQRISNAPWVNRHIAGQSNISPAQSFGGRVPFSPGQFSSPYPFARPQANFMNVNYGG